jgi:phage major head subunit gpT-like protein
LSEATARKLVSIGMQQRAASFQPASFDAEKRTVDLTWTTGAKGLRGGGWSDPYHEELEVSPTAVRLDRLNAGAPLLDSHRGWGLDGVIGVVESARIEGGQGIATVRFADDEASQAIMRKVQDGILRNISVGYQVHKYRDVSQEGDRYRTFRAVDWEPMELSIVPIPFDAGAQVRAADGTPTVETEIIFNPELPGNTRSERPMSDTNTTPEAMPQVDAAKVAAEAKAVERKRAAEITELCRKAGCDDLAAKFIADDATVDAARAAVLDAMIERSKKDAVKGGVRVEAGGLDEIETRRAAVESALLHRYDSKRFDLSEPAREYRSMSLLEIGRELLEKRGERVRGLAKHQVAERALHSTSDFPEILANVASKTLRKAYDEAPKTFMPIVRVVEVPDFKSVSRAQLGEAPVLEEINEHGEYKRGTVADGAETYAIATYGKVVGITRKVIINDDLDAFTRLPEMFGRAAANKESDLVWAVFTANAAMADGVALFHATHANLGSAGAISVTTLTEGRKLMRLQEGLDGSTLLNIMPQYLIVPAALETVAKQYVASDLVPSQASNVNPFKGSLVTIVEPRLDGSSPTAWYLAADPAQVDTIELAYLQGQRGVYIETRTGFDVDGVEVKARLDVGAKAIDHRGLFKNAGA